MNSTGMKNKKNVILHMNKVTDVHEYHIDTFVMGDDWKGEFDFLEKEGVEVVYLPRTPEISTTEIKNSLATREY